jgi:hypothetical protein
MALFSKDTTPVTATQREKANWDGRKAFEILMRDRHGSYVSKPRVISYIAAGRNALMDALKAKQPLSRQAARQFERRDLAKLLPHK